MIVAHDCEDVNEEDASACVDVVVRFQCLSFGCSASQARLIRLTRFWSAFCSVKVGKRRRMNDGLAMKLK